MAWTDGFFNSVNGDRVYNADQMSNIFEGIITYGVYKNYANKLAVEANSGMTIQINTGRGWFSGRWVNNDSVYTMTLEDSDVTLNRYCAVCIRVDNTTSVRSAKPYLKYGEYATSPTKPTMERSATVNEYCLAYVYIGAGVTEITGAVIEDSRFDTSVCGWVTCILDNLDANGLYKQWEAIFYKWFDELEDYLDQDVETKLVADMMEVKNRCTKVSGTFDALGWSSQGDGTYTQTINVAGVTATNDIMVAPDDEYKDTYVDMDCEAISQGDGTITFMCYNPQDVAVKVNVIIFNFPT